MKKKNRSFKIFYTATVFLLKLKINHMTFLNFKMGEGFTIKSPQRKKKKNVLKSTIYYMHFTYRLQKFRKKKKYIYYQNHINFFSNV